MKTPLYEEHVALGAKIIPFAGWEMPVRYSGDKEEHLLVREKAGLFDVSHMGEFIIRGEGALDLVQKVSSNDASKLPVGKAQYACLPNHSGGIVDDMIVYHVEPGVYMLVVNASNIQKDWDWVVASNTMGAELIDISDKTALIAVSGPAADAVVEQLTELPVRDLKTYEFVYGELMGIEKVLIATTGYTGERTFELFFRKEHAVDVWRKLLEVGEKVGLKPAGLGARDTLRLEMGYMLYGNDIDDTTSPIEAGLGWITKLKKPHFNGIEEIKKVKAAGPKKKLVCFELQVKGIPRHGYEIMHEGKAVGRVTSGSLSPMKGSGIGMGYVPTELAILGDTIGIQVRNKVLPATIIRAPFIEK